MKAVIFCDDSSLFAKANAALLREGCRSEVRAQWTINSWPVDDLSQASIAEEALIEAADTHLVIIPARHARSVPFGLRDWLQQWAAIRQIPDAALAVIGDGTNVGSPKTVSPELTMFALKHELNLIIDESTAFGNATETVVGLLLEREFPLPLELRRLEYTVTHESFRSFGINE